MLQLTLDAVIAADERGFAAFLRHLRDPVSEIAKVICQYMALFRREPAPDFIQFAPNRMRVDFMDMLGVKGFGDMFEDL